MSRRALLLALGALLLLALLVAGYSPARHGAFQWDDLPSITRNEAIRDLRGAAAALWNRTGALGRPVADLTFAADHWRAGLDPAAFHATSLAVHLLATALAFLFARETLRRAGREQRPEGLALAVVGLWALHPLQSEAVSYIVQRAEALASALYLAALLLLLAAWRRGRSAAGAALYAAGLVTFALGLRTKLVVVTLPATFLLHLALFDPRPGGGPPARRWGSRLLAAAPLLAGSALAAAGALLDLRGHADAGFGVSRAFTGSYPLSQLRAVWCYLGLLAWPAGLTVDHDLAPSRSLLDPPATLLAGAGLAALCALATWLLLRSRRPGRDPALAAAERLTAFGSAWFLLLLSPTSSVVPLADLLVEHRAYLASLGPLLAVAAWSELLLARLVPPGRRPLAAAGATLALWCVLAAALHDRNEVWTSPLALWSDAVRKSPGKFRAHFNLGYALAESGNDRAALAEYRLALALPAPDAVELSRLRRNMGSSLVLLGRFDEAIGVLLQALPVEPASPDLHNNLAIAWLRKGDLARAEEHAALAIRHVPRYWQAHNTLGEVLAARGDLPGALAAFSTGARLVPDLLTPLGNVALAEELLGRRREACATWARYARLGRGEGRANAADQMARLHCGTVP